MRLILFALAVANLRWSKAALSRSDWLFAESEKAFAESEARLALADSLMQRGRSLA